MNIRRLLLDVDKALQRPSLLEIGEAISNVKGVEGFNIEVAEIDVETVDMNITIEGQNLDYGKIQTAIENSGAVVHSIDQLGAGERIITPVKQAR
ncbi:DUF211 domain-containing protein [Patescibacteria group bacterium]|nr:DUF211 domain-containing protein [Patescibacteria group bacterium]